MSETTDNQKLQKADDQELQDGRVKDIHAHLAIPDHRLSGAFGYRGLTHRDRRIQQTY